MSRKACSRRSPPGYRAVAILMTPLVAIASIGSGCTTPQTYYQPDGTPYTREELDAGETLLALLILGGLAAWAASESETKRYE